jgi:hypothetical protein
VIIKLKHANLDLEYLKNLQINGKVLQNIARTCI